MHAKLFSQEVANNSRDSIRARPPDALYQMPVVPANTAAAAAAAAVS